MRSQMKMEMALNFFDLPRGLQLWEDLKIFQPEDAKRMYEDMRRYEDSIDTQRKERHE